MIADRNRRIVLLGLLLATLAAVAAYVLIASRPAPPPTVVEVTPTSGEPVLVGAGFIPQGTVLEARNLEVAYVPAGARAERALTDAEQAVGKVALADIPAGEQIETTDLGDGDSAVVAGDTYARDVPVGLRAVTIASAETIGVGGFLQPGDRVDVVAAMELQPANPSMTLEDALGALGGPAGNEGDGGDGGTDEGSAGGEEDAADPFSMAELILQDVEVLAVGQAIDAEANAAAAGEAAAEDGEAAAAETSEEGETGLAPNAAATSVTLLVTPADSLRLLLAEQAGAGFRLLLRSPGDTSRTELPPALITNGITNMEPFQLVGSNLIAQDLVVTGARFRETTVPAGDILEFEATVRNVSSRLLPAGSGGAEPGHVYAADETWRSLAEPAPAGVYTLGVTAANMAPQTYPWRWSLGEDLEPGQTATITGSIQAPLAPGVQRWWFGTLLQPGTVVQDGVAPVEITIEPATTVTVNVDEASLREAPWETAAVVETAARGAELDVLEQRDGWFLVRAGEGDAWVAAEAVLNAALAEATPVAGAG